jgi:hypothetical protein
MANDIASHVRNQVEKLSDTLENLQRLQAVTSDCHHVEDLQDTWLLRQHFMVAAEAQWNDLAALLLREVLPFVADLRKGVSHI